MKKGKKIIALVAGVAAAALTLLIVYHLTINDTVDTIVISWLSGFNIVFIAAILVWCALDLEKR